MTAEAFTPTVGVSMTPSAVKHVHSQLSKHPGAHGIRLAVKKSGCSGFMYDIEWVSEPQDDDQVFQIAENIAVYVRRKDLPVVNGTEIDFITKGLNSLFQFRNPNATAECGCGESFSIT